MEIGTLQKYVHRFVRYTRIQTSEDTANTHGFFNIAYHKVPVGELALHTVESDERGTFGHGTHYHLAALDLIGVKAVQRLSVSEQYVVGNIYYVVYRMQPYDSELLL